MARSSQFQEDRQPLASHPDLKPSSIPPKGPFSFLNPTRHSFIHSLSRSGSDTDDEPTVPTDAVHFRWTSRNNRKGRHQLDYAPSKDPTHANYLAPPSSSSPQAVIKVIIRMFISYPVWDISWLVAYIFVWGSIIWVINAFFVWYPLQSPSSEFPDEVYSAGGITAFIGATVFALGSVLLFIEAVNENREGCFGWAIERMVSENSKGQWRVVPSRDVCQHSHTNRGNLVGKGGGVRIDHAGNDEENPKYRHQTTAGSKETSDDGDTSPQKLPTQEERSWTWFPSFKDLRHHYVHELGFLACSAQLYGATIFWISGFTALPGVYNHLNDAGLKGAYYAPQIIGGSGFIISGTLFMLETQEIWYKPALGTLGWHIGLLNLIGGWGFTLCPIFGLVTASWGPYEEALATFWGSWAFLLASVLQWYESLQKNPVSVKK